MCTLTTSDHKIYCIHVVPVSEATADDEDDNNADHEATDSDTTNGNLIK